MPSLYPDAFDTFPIPGQNQKTETGAPTHSQLHRDLGLSIEAVEATLGLNPQGAFSTVVARLQFLETIALSGDSVIVLEGLEDHLVDPVDAHDASAISFVPVGSISSTNVQAAITEVSIEAGTNTYPSITDDGVNIFIEPSNNMNVDVGNGFNVDALQVIINSNGVTADLTLDAGRHIFFVAGTDINFQGTQVTDVGSVGHKISTIAATGATETINSLDFSIFDLTLTANCDITISGTPSSTQDVTIKVIIRGAFSPNFLTVLWPNGMMPLHDGSVSIYYLTWDQILDQWLGLQAATGFS